MVHSCILCGEKIVEEFGKLAGTILKVKNKPGKNEFLYVCSDCTKTDNWIENAKVKGA